eukprot:TRINITY_DN5939_c0_g1_i1.p1 TRINITY_DN5939_c0_g1~~TRINITY_DN5939_c0_g1_i1.p1  ORF type:complete len:757 (-),score=120.15 TRINITY_DN5939_c0_g1_i1:154-2424(-)
MYPRPARPRRGDRVGCACFAGCVILAFFFHVLYVWAPRENALLSICDPTSLLSRCLASGEDAMEIVVAQCASYQFPVVEHAQVSTLLAQHIGRTAAFDLLQCAHFLHRVGGFNFEDRTIRRLEDSAGSARDGASPGNSQISGRDAGTDSGGTGSGVKVGLAGGYEAALERLPEDPYHPSRRTLSLDDPIVIIGGGPTGLCAAARLEELGHRRWTLVEGKAKTSGLSTSIRDAQGFVWDIGVHIGFSHYEFFDQLLQRSVPPAEWFTRNRSSPIFMEGRFIGYPLQYYFWQLSDESAGRVTTSLREMLEAQERGGLSPQSQPRPTNFHEYSHQRFGDALSELFMLPYNAKVWAHPPRELNTLWVGERVAPLKLRQILYAAATRQESAPWGPNARFVYPLHGTGQVWEAVGQALPADRVRTRTLAREVRAIPATPGTPEMLEVHVEENAPNGARRVERDPHQMWGHRRDGGYSGDDDGGDPPGNVTTVLPARAVLSTMGLDHLVSVVRAPEAMRRAMDEQSRAWLSSTYPAAPPPPPIDTLLDPQGIPDRFKHTRLHLVGLGFAGDVPPRLVRNPTAAESVRYHHWVYFPESDYPFYRMTLMSVLSPGMAPPGTWSLMFEVSESKHRPMVFPSKDALIEAIFGTLVRMALVKRDQRPISTFYHFEYRGYPVPYTSRNEHVHTLDNILRPYLGIWSRGRFGSWKYEVSNQDHSCMLGVEAVDAMLFNSTELTFTKPNVVNAGKRTHRAGFRPSVSFPML